MKRHDKIEEGIELDLFVCVFKYWLSVISLCAKVWAEILTLKCIFGSLYNNYTVSNFSFICVEIVFFVLRDLSDCPLCS